MKNLNIKSIIILFTCFSVFACKNASTNVNNSNIWTYNKSISLDSFGIVGIAKAVEDGFLWLADADNNQLVRISSDGQVVETVEGFDRPMHLMYHDGAILVAEYGADIIRSFHHSTKDTIVFSEKFDAPSGVDFLGSKKAVVDFYNHRIVYTDGEKNLTFGEKGEGPGQFTYPTDVQFSGGKLYVADAYNHRVQVFDMEGKHLQTIGVSEQMNAATGIFVDSKYLYVTDFENSRILIYDLKGMLIQMIDQNLDKPSDVLVMNDTLYVVNYHGRSLALFTFVQK
ncbi:MAG: NHL repeat-containing protein [Saprospiraceae bacterium]|nr:NHL repeat-containing protein [Saprospiraceae bacterium]